MNFEWDEYFWTTKIELPEWKRFSPPSPYPNQAEAIERGIFPVVFASEKSDDPALTPDELELAEWFVRNHQDQAKSVVAAIFDKYPTIRDDYLDAIDPACAAQDLPQIQAKEDLEALIGLVGINIHQIRKDGIPYVGYEFSCSWDQEHGAGVLMHGNRCVEVGGADCAILLWIAEADAKLETDTN